MTKVLIIVLALVPLILAAPQSSAAPHAVKPGSLKLAPCDVQGISGKAQCGNYEVYESRTSKKGRKIKLKILVLPATAKDRTSDPFVYFAGGPGSSATEDAVGVAGFVAKIREHRDLVFVDQRGTGGSNPLDCEFFNASNLQSYLGYFFPLEDVRKCREQLEPKADLTLYTTSIAADDLDEVRAALGYEQLNLFGGSYGTRAALVYLRRHPSHVRTITLSGVSPTNQSMPRDFPQDTERALQGILAECAADEMCNRAFPNLRTEARSVLEALLQSPVETEVRNPNLSGATSSDKRIRVRLSRDLAAEAIRYMLYNPPPASQVPLFLHLAAQGDFVPLAEAAIRFRRLIVATGSNGMYLSVTCAEDLPWIKPGEGERNATNTFLGDYRLRQQREACALWPRAIVRPDYGNPVKSSVPALILTGEWDPVTPPSNAEAVAKNLPNSLNLVVPHGAHGFGGLEGLDCIDRLLTEFVERGSAKELDTSCLKNIRRRGFILKR
jgi:pimeloyl-ACP methyl ester carboxylesterase